MNEHEMRMMKAIQRKMRRRILWGAIVLAVIVGTSYFFVWYSKRPVNIPGETYAELSRDHVSLDHQDTYNSNPPSSGPHYPSPANWGAYDYEVADKIFIHNLEHGGIWISYKPTVAPAVVDGLKSVMKEFSDYKLVMAPRSANDADVAVAAWAHVYKFNLKDPTQLSPEEKKSIEKFYYALKDHGPEYVPGNMPGVDPKDVGGALKP